MRRIINMKTSHGMMIILALSLLFSGSAFAQIDPQAWYDDNPSNDTFYIGTADELDYLSTIVNSGTDTFQNKTILLTSNIDLAGFNESDGGWKPIGTYVSRSDFTRAFRGTFNGNGYTIKYLTINRPTTANQGLFGLVYTDGNVKNLALIDVNIKGGQYTGGVTGRLANAIVENVFATGEISGNIAGGIAGYLSDNARITDCYTSVVLDDSTVQAGGIAGYTYLGEIENCYTIATTLTLGTNNGVGGISGAMGNNASIKNSAVIIEKINAATGHIGRIAGYPNTLAVLSNNIAWEGTRNINNDLFFGDIDDRNGESKTTEEIFSLATWSALVFSDEYWQITAGRPPILKVFLDNPNITQIEEYPEYLSVEPREILPEQEWFYNNDGSGTYYIGTAEELAYFAHVTRNIYDFAGKTIMLTADIDLADIEPELGKYKLSNGADYDGKGWIMGGNLTGTFDGNGHVVKNLYINRPDRGSSLIGGTTSNIGLVKNLGIIDAYIAGGFATGIIVTAGSIENSFTTGSVSGIGVVGGIVAVLRYNTGQ